MAIHQNPALPNRHRLYCAMSGGGKTQAMSANLPRKGRVLLWDTHETFKAEQHSTIWAFKRAVAAAILKKGGFFIAYTGPGTVAAFESFCSVVWDILDGRKDTHICIDELSEVTNPGKAKDKLGELLRGSRKYGGIMHISVNALPEVPKTVRRETLIKWAGKQQTLDDKKMMADFLGVKPEAFNELEPLEFLVLEGGKVTKKRIKHKRQPL